MREDISGKLQEDISGEFQEDNSSELQQSNMTKVTHEKAVPDYCIMNLQLLSKHIEEVTQHVAACSTCCTLAQSSDALTMVGKKNHNGLASIMGCEFNGC